MSIRNYNAFLREVRKKHGLTQKQAQAAYRKTATRLGRPAKGTDVKRHPRIVKESIRRRRKPEGSRKEPGQRVRKVRTINSISEWRRLRVDSGGDTVRVVSSADYGRRRGRK